MVEIANDTPAAKARKRWKASSPAMKPQAGASGLINLGLMIWTLWDIRHRRADEIKGNRKLWILAAFAPPVGPIAYFVFGRKRRSPMAEIPLETTE
jgi:hypothetical protein